MKKVKEVLQQERKQQILDALDNETIQNIYDAIDYLENKDGLDVEEVSYKWKVTSCNGEVFSFQDDNELIEWAREERDKIEALKK